MSRAVIAVDGLSGSGKTSLSKALADRLGWAFFSTGSLYRAVGILAREQQVSFADERQLEELVQRSALRVFGGPHGEQLIGAGDRVFGGELFLPEASDGASRVAPHAAVRSALLPIQRSAFPGLNLVAEGRDTGTIVFPDAIAKFFIEAPPALRAARRLGDFRAQGVQTVESATEAQALLEQEIFERDTRDSTRSVAPLTAASDAIHIDNSADSLTAALDCMYSALLSRGIIAATSLET